MNAELTTTAASNSHSVLQRRGGSLETKVGSLASMAPAFFLVGAGAIAYPDPTPEYYPDPHWVHYKSGISPTTPSILDTLRQTSLEDLVIAKLDSIFESLLASQRDLDQADHKAIASKLWELYR
jgi:hypothetical protein